jgi:hypothetical protein
MYRTCSMHWGGKQVYTPFQSGNLKERDHLGHLVCLGG